MKHSERPLWKKSMLETLSLYDINNWLDEIMDNGDIYGYARDRDYYTGEDGYYQEYKDQFDDLSSGAYRLWETLQESDLRANWDDMTVALLGNSYNVLGFDVIERDYYRMINCFEDAAIREAMKRLERLSKRDLIECFKKVLTTLLLFYDLKTAHDCLTSIVTELDERAAMMQRNGEPPQRSWVE